MTTSLKVELGERSYEIRVGAGLLQELGSFARQAACAGARACRGAVVISDSNVAPLYAQAALDSLQAAELPARLLTFPAGEPNKTLATYGNLIDQLLSAEPPIDRSTLVVALGGGVTGDMAGFVAATALRGLPWLQCPTSLLAAVDASVGGKTAVDSRAGKNLIGAFHQPRGVLIDVHTLQSLPREQYVDGLAECVKHAIIRDRLLLEWMEDSTVPILARDEAVLSELIARNVAIKAQVVAADERESGERAHLNFGHTIGHAIETLVGYEHIAHGAAVSLGMVAACEMAVTRGLLEREAAQRVRQLLVRLGLPVKLEDRSGPSVPTPQDVWRLMQHDKKVQGGSVRMILPTTLGNVAIFDDVTPQQVAAALAAIR